MPLRVGGHRLGFPELRDQQRVARHRHLEQFVGERHAMNVERRLAVECQLNRECPVGRERPFLMGESQGPSRLVIDRDDKIDAAFILRSRSAMRESAALVVRVSPALPVADIDGSARARWRLNARQSGTRLQLPLRLQIS